MIFIKFDFISIKLSSEMFRKEITLVKYKLQIVLFKKLYFILEDNLM